MGTAGPSGSPATPRLLPRRPRRRSEAPGVRCNCGLRGTLGTRCALRSSVTSPLESSPGSSASCSERRAGFPRDERCLQGKLPGPTRGRTAPPPFASSELLAGQAAFAERPLPPPRGAALLTWLQLVGATSRRASAPPLVTRPARGLPPAGAQPRSSPPAPRPQRAAVRPPSPGAGQEGRRPRHVSSAIANQTVHQTIDDDQPCEFFKKGNRVNESHHKSSGMIAGPSWNKAQRLKNSSGKRQSKPQERHVSSQPTGSPAGVPQAAGGEREGRMAPEGPAERSPLGPACQGASGNELFLAFQSLRIIKEDADEDSASDLSDSERVPMSPSPLSPPDLRLRAEEIDPVHFDAPPGRGHARPEASYPDFLPAPFSSWDLRDMALLLHAEQRPAAVPRAGGPLGRFVDRLVQLEWLQMRTVQGERAKAAKVAKAKAPAAAAKSPGRGQPVAGAASRAPQGAAPKPGPARKRGCPREDGRAPGPAFQTPPGPLHVLSSQKQTLDPRAEDKKKKAASGGGRPRGDPGDADAGPQIESSGNIRALKHSAMILDAVDSRKAPKTQAHANLKKKGNASNCGHSPLSSEKKLRTNGGKQSARKFK